MKALSIQQPWAWLIVMGIKDIENRDWYTPYRGPFLVHAGKKIDKQAYEWIRSNFGIVVPCDIPAGGIVGKSRIFDCVTKSSSRWFFGKHGFTLGESEPMEFIPYRGQLGFFDVPDTIGDKKCQ